MKKRVRRIAIAGVVMMLGLVAFMGVGGFAANSDTAVINAKPTAPTINVTVTTDPIAIGGVPGIPGSAAWSVSVQSNKAWTLTVQADGTLHNGETYLTTDGLTIASDEYTGAVPVGSAQQIDSGPRGASNVASGTYSWDPPYEADPDLTYTATHTFTGLQP